jgi:hypothetical protein
MVPVKVPFQRLKKLVKCGGHTYDAEHRAILLTPPARGRWVHSLTLHGGLPLLPLLSSPLRNVPLQKSVNLRILLSHASPLSQATVGTVGRIGS